MDSLEQSILKTGILSAFILTLSIYVYTLLKDKVVPTTYPVIVEDTRIGFQPGIFSGDTKFKTVYKLRIPRAAYPTLYRQKDEPLCCTFEIGDTIGIMDSNNNITWTYESNMR